MARIKYVGTADQRIISKADWKTAGFDNEDPVDVDLRQSFNEDLRIIEVSEKAAKFLLESEPREWKRTDEEPADAGDDAKKGKAAK